MKKICQSSCPSARWTFAELADLSSKRSALLVWLANMTTARKPRQPMTCSRCSDGVMLVLLGALGFTVSTYGAYVEHQKRLDPANYRALCDFAGYSCSSVMTSEFGNMLRYHGVVDRDSWLDQPNAVLGAGAYTLFMLYPVLRKIPFHEYFYVLASFVAVGLSGYLAYILAFVLRDLCMICVTSYVINAALAWYSLKLLRGEKLKTT